MRLLHYCDKSLIYRIPYGGVPHGLHFQHPKSGGKLVSVLHGCVLDVAVDVRFS